MSMHGEWRLRDGADKDGPGLQVSALLRNVPPPSRGGRVASRQSTDAPGGAPTDTSSAMLGEQHAVSAINAPGPCDRPVCELRVLEALLKQFVPYRLADAINLGRSDLASQRRQGCPYSPCFARTSVLA